MSLIEERLTEQFLEWEVRGRGWQLWDAPVSPEPAFRPFRGHYLPEEGGIDDGRKPTAISSFIRTLSARLAGNGSPPVKEEKEDEEPQPRLFARSEMVELHVVLPSKDGLAGNALLFFLSGLSRCAEPMVFELVGEPGKISCQFAVHPGDMPLLYEQLAVISPEVQVFRRQGFLESLWGEFEEDRESIVECRLAREFMLPLGRIKGDPLTPIVGTLGDIGEGESAVFQVIFEPVRHPWSESVLRSVTDPTGAAFFLNADYLLKGARQKVSLPLYAATLRLAAKSPHGNRAVAIVGNLVAALRVYDDPAGNRLIPVDDDGCSTPERRDDLIRRQSHRSGMLLNSDELESLVHLPSDDVRSLKLRMAISKTKTAPSIVFRSHGLVLGTNVHRGGESAVTLSPDQRMRHMHVIGASGTGKSTLLYNCIMQDIRQGNGIAVLDPHGDLIDAVLGSIPEERINDVVLIDPSDIEHPVGFNILQAHSEIEKTLLASDLVAVFERLSRSWGDQMGSVLRYAILAFLESETGGTLADLRRFLLDPQYRAAFIATVRDPDVVYFWQKGFPALSGNKSIGPVLTRLEGFLALKSIRRMVSQKENRLDFGSILDDGKILLAKLSQGAIGRENSYLLGTLIVSKLQQLAMSRQDKTASSRRDFYVYIDECHNFITPSMAEILSGARKYRLGLVLSHQELRQLEVDREVSSAVLANAYTRVCFRLGDLDSRSLATSFTGFEAKDLQNLGTGEAICRVERAGFDFNLSIPNGSYPEESEGRGRRDQVVAASRKSYAAANASALEIPTPIPPSAPVVPPFPQKLVVAASPVPKQTAVVPPPAPLIILPPAVPEPSSAGRGGKEHKYLQNLIKQWAEGMGWRAAIEDSVADGAGSVDISLRKGTLSIACEISVTTPADYEVGNLKKCLAAGFSFVVSVSSDEKHRMAIERVAMKKLSPKELERVRWFTPHQLFEFVQNQEAKSAGKETTVKGYRVKVSYRALSPEETKNRKENVARIVAHSLQENLKK